MLSTKINKPVMDFEVINSLLILSPTMSRSKEIGSRFDSRSGAGVSRKGLLFSFTRPGAHRSRFACQIGLIMKNDEVFWRERAREIFVLFSKSQAILDTKQ